MAADQPDEGLAPPVSAESPGDPQEGELPEMGTGELQTSAGQVGGAGRGMMLSEVIAAMKDPNDPRHSDALAASRRLSEGLQPAVQALGEWAVRGQGHSDVRGQLEGVVQPMTMGPSAAARTAALTARTLATLEAIEGTLLQQNEAAELANRGASKVANRTLWVAVATLVVAIVTLVISVS